MNQRTFAIHKKKSSPVVVSILACIAFLSFVAYIGAPRSNIVVGKRQCHHSVEYYSSAMEQLWLDNVKQWGSSEAAFCEAVGSAQQKEWVQIWLNQVAEDKGQRLVEFDPAVFSRFKIITACPGSANVEQVTFIEPLAHGLRHPNALCNMGADVMNRDYLLLADGRHTNASDASRIYIDLGGTTWEQADTPGQQWFARSYDARGLPFDRLLLWEARPITPPSNIFQQLPPEYFHKYQYFNIPASSANTAANPVHILRTIARPEDFVVFKLDIDTPALESEFLGQLMAPQASPLVDEFFFEYHVDFAPMLKYWGSGSATANSTHEDAFNLFLQLRRRGWRAHSWV